MRKTPSHNPRGFERNSWNYRCIQLRHALGWTQQRFAKTSGICLLSVRHLEQGMVVRPAIDTIRKIKAMEASYADVLKQYKKAPVRMDRLKPYHNHSTGVRLLPIEIRRPADLETMGAVAGDSEPLFFGRGTRRKMQQTGMPLSRKAYLIRRGKAISLALRRKDAERRRQEADHNEVESGQPHDSGA